MIFQLLCAVTLTAATPVTDLPKGLTLYQEVDFIGQVQLHNNVTDLSDQMAYIEQQYLAQMRAINGKIDHQFMATPRRIEHKFLLGGSVYHDLKNRYTFHGNTFFMDRNEQ